MKMHWTGLAAASLLLATQTGMVLGLNFDQGVDGRQALKNAQTATVAGSAGKAVTSSGAQEQDDSQALAAFVKKNLRKLEKQGARELELEEISFDDDSIRCVAVSSMMKGDSVVGTCILTGEQDYPNSSSVFAISVKDEEDNPQPVVTVAILSAEL